jgi:methanogenic corrinoid protein MtbC1
LLAPAARHLGYLWDEDMCDFTQVTIGLVRMQQITLRLGSEFQEKRKLAMEGMRVLFAPVPGSQHTFGVLMVSEFFRREGWQVWMELGSSEATLLEAVKKDWFDVIGLSVGIDAHVESLTDSIRHIRLSSANRNAKILIGGPLLALSPDLYKEVGADGAASDAATAVELARTLF